MIRAIRFEHYFDFIVQFHWQQATDLTRNKL